MVRLLDTALKEGSLASRHVKRSFTKRATPFLFPEAHSVNLYAFGSKVQKVSATDARVAHREKFWNTMNREEILMHDHAAWQKLAQLEENLKMKRERRDAGVLRDQQVRSRDFKGVNKLV